MEQGERYRFREWPHDGELFELDGDVLVNLTTPGGDLLVGPEGRLFDRVGHPAGHLSDLEPGGDLPRGGYGLPNRVHHVSKP
jgi:hypothetical protein